MESSIFGEKYTLFRELLVEARQLKKITQIELASALKKPQSFVSKYESGERRIDVIEFLEISEALGINTSKLIRKLRGYQPKFIDSWDITTENIDTLLTENPSLRGMLFGYVAELKLKTLISSFPHIKSMKKYDDHDRKKKGDLHFIYKNTEFSIESKSLQTNQIKFDPKAKIHFGKAQVDASDRRTIQLPNGEEVNTTLLLKGEFDILAVNCYQFNQRWDFQFARNKDLPTSNYKSYSDEAKRNLIKSLIPVEWPPKKPFHSNLELLIEEILKD